MSGGLTPCRQLRPSSRREHVRASNSQIGLKKTKQKNPEHIQSIRGKWGWGWWCGGGGVGVGRGVCVLLAAGKQLDLW